MSQNRSCLASGIKKNFVEQEITFPPGVVYEVGKSVILSYEELVRK